MFLNKKTILNKLKAVLKFKNGSINRQEAQRGLPLELKLCVCRPLPLHEIPH